MGKIKITNKQADGNFTMQLPADFLPKLSKRPVSRAEAIEKELSAIRRIDKKKSLPEIVSFLNEYAAKLHDELKVIQRRKV